jgi:hypothetical protein
MNPFPPTTRVHCPRSRNLCKSKIQALIAFQTHHDIPMRVRMNPFPPTTRVHCPRNRNLCNPKTPNADAFFPIPNVETRSSPVLYAPMQCQYLFPPPPILSSSIYLCCALHLKPHKGACDTGSSSRHAFLQEAFSHC